jgi:hypothetical protein
MIAKPAISFLNDDSDSLLTTDAGSIVTKMTGNPNYPAPTPTLQDVSTALNAFNVALTAATGGGVVLTLAKNARRVELVALLRTLAIYVQLNCHGDMTKLLSSGFPAQKNNRQPVGPLPAPSTPALSLGARSGELNAKVSPVAGASVYTWQISTSDAPEQWQPMGQTTGARNVFTGLTPGTIYNVQANAVGAAGPSDWSNVSSQMVI